MWPLEFDRVAPSRTLLTRAKRESKTGEARHALSSHRAASCPSWDRTRTLLIQSAGPRATTTDKLTGRGIPAPRSAQPRVDTGGRGLEGGIARVMIAARLRPPERLPPMILSHPNDHDNRSFSSSSALAASAAAWERLAGPESTPESR